MAFPRGTIRTLFQAVVQIYGNTIRNVHRRKVCSKRWQLQPETHGRRRKLIAVGRTIRALVEEEERRRRRDVSGAINRCRQ